MLAWIITFSFLTVCSLYKTIRYHHHANSHFQTNLFDTPEQRKQKKKRYFELYNVAESKKDKDALRARQWWYWRWKKREKISLLIGGIFILITAILVSVQYL